MKRFLPIILGLCFALSATAQKAAPAFSVEDANGKTHTKASCAGKVTVLEWVNPTCPYVKKFYGAGAMQKMQKEFTGRGVTWLSIGSSPEGKPGYLTKESVPKTLSDWKAAPSAVLLDAEGTVGKAFKAQRTPTVVVLDTKGRIVFHGGIDAELSFDPKRHDPKINFVRDALNEVLAGKKVSRSSSRPTGCSIKYKK